MDENGADTPEQVLKFVPKERLRGYAPLVEEAGEAIIAKIQQAADLSNENCDRAMKLAHRRSRLESRSGIEISDNPLGIRDGAICR